MEELENFPIKRFPDVRASGGPGPGAGSVEEQFMNGLKSSVLTGSLLEQLSAEVTSSLDRHYDRLTNYFDHWMQRNEQSMKRSMSQSAGPFRHLSQRQRPSTASGWSSSAFAQETLLFAPELLPRASLQVHSRASRKSRHSTLSTPSVNSLPLNVGRDYKLSIGEAQVLHQEEIADLQSPRKKKSCLTASVSSEADFVPVDSQEQRKSTSTASNFRMMGSMPPIGENGNLTGSEDKDQVDNKSRKEKRKGHKHKSIFSLDDLEDIKREAFARVVGSKQLAMQHVQSEEKEEDVQTPMQQFVNNYRFEMFFAVAIMTNSILVGVQVQYAAEHMGDDNPTSFMVIQHLYAYIFLIELLCRLAAQRLRFFCNESWFWNYLDLLIVGTSLLEVIVDIMSLLNDADVGSTENLSSIRIVRIIRMTRLVRVFRIIRIVRFVRALRTLVYSIICTLKSLVWSMLLLVMIVYVFGILFTQATTEHMLSEDSSKNTDDDELIGKYWSSLPRSMFTLLKSISNGISWEIVVHPLSSIHWFWVMLFNGFIVFVYFCVLNVVTGVFCQSAIESAQHDQEMLIQEQIANKHMYIRKLRELFRDLDSTDAGWITINELERNLSEPRVEAFFSSLELEPSDAWALFKLLDIDQSAVVDIEEFVIGCLRLRGQAKAIDLAKQSYELKFLMRKLSLFMKFVEERFGLLLPDAPLFEAESARSSRVTLIRDSTKSRIGAESEPSTPCQSQTLGENDPRE